MTRMEIETIRPILTSSNGLSLMTSISFRVLKNVGEESVAEMAQSEILIQRTESETSI